MTTIYPCIWFDTNAIQAANFYCNIFNNSNLISENPIVVIFEIEGFKIMALNGGPKFSITPSISLFVNCNSEDEIDNLYNKLMDGGTVMMQLDKYPFAEKYAWVKDKFGMTWQLIYGGSHKDETKIKPAFLFVGNQYGNAYNAIKDYTNLFPTSSIIHTSFYGDFMPQDMQGKLMFSLFNIGSKSFVAMDGPGNHAYNFTEGVSLVIECEIQADIDLYWNTLTQEGEESMCGWLKDKYGVSWQIVPSILGSLMNDKEKAARVMQAFLKMKKFDIQTLLDA